MDKSKSNVLPYYECSKRTKYRRRHEEMRAVSIESDSELSDEEVNSHSDSELVVESGAEQVESPFDNIENITHDNEPVGDNIRSVVDNGFGNVVNNVINDDDQFHDACSDFSDQSEDDEDGNILYFDTSDSESTHSIEDEDIVVEERFDDSNRSALWKDLVVWSIFHRIGHNALCALLKILKLCNVNEVKSLPLDARTLKCTPQNVKTDVFEEGAEYYHFDLLEELLKALNLRGGSFKKIEVLFGLDGVPLYKSVRMEFWPILCKILSVPGLEHHVFPVGLFCGRKKPQNLEKYLDKFIQDVIFLSKHGVTFNGKIYDFIIKGFSCDCQAKSMVLCIMASNGYGSCTKCQQKGDWSYVCRRVFFPEVNSTPRTNEDFLQQTDVNFHNGVSPLTQIPNFDFVNWFPLDYLHLLCVGVTRTLLGLWVKSSKNRCHLPADKVSQASGRMLLFQRFIPSDFAKDTRAFEEFKRWKATELRLFICYLAPFIMDGILSATRQTNLLLLYVAVRLLLNPVQCREFKETATSLLIEFVQSCKTAYHSNILTHNFHNLIHLPSNLNTFNNMEECSSFDFESFLYILKKCLKKGGAPIQQAIKRWYERTSVNANAPKKPVKEPFCNVGNRGGPLLDGCSNPQYRNVHFPSFKLSLSARDCCFTSKDGSIVVARNICYHTPSSSMVFVGQKFLSQTNAFTFPCDSSRLAVFYVSGLSDLVLIPFDEVHYKNMILPCKDGYIVQPLLHSLS